MAENFWVAMFQRISSHVPSNPTLLWYRQNQVPRKKNNNNNDYDGNDDDGDKIKIKFFIEIIITDNHDYIMV